MTWMHQGLQHTHPVEALLVSRDFHHLDQFCERFTVVGFHVLPYFPWMARSEKKYLLELWSKNVCPACGKNIPQGTRVGSGKKSEGGFCSVDCYSEYYKAGLIERGKKVAALVQRLRNS